MQPLHRQSWAETEPGLPRHPRDHDADKRHTCTQTTVEARLHIANQPCVICYFVLGCGADGSQERDPTVPKAQLQKAGGTEAGKGRALIAMEIGAD